MSTDTAAILEEIDKEVEAIDGNYAQDPYTVDLLKRTSILLLTHCVIDKETAEAAKNTLWNYGGDEYTAFCNELSRITPEADK